MTNLLPPKKKREIAKVYRLRVVTVVVYVAASIVLVAMALLAPTLFLVETERADLESHLSDMGMGESEGGTVDGDSILDVSNEKLSILSAGVGSYQTVSYVHEVVLGYKTAEITLKRFSLDTQSASEDTRGKLTLSGEAITRQSLESFVDSLEQDPLFGNISDPISNYVEDTDLPFSIVVTIVNNEE
jgi:hypothetical protein